MALSRFVLVLQLVPECCPVRFRLFEPLPAACSTFSHLPQGKNPRQREREQTVITASWWRLVAII